MEKMTGEELRRRYFNGERDFSAVDLSRELVTGSDASEDFFVEIDLSGINLSGANLSKADLSGGNFTDADFSGANLEACPIYKCNLTGTNFSRADLRGAEMTESIMEYTNFREANLGGVRVSHWGKNCDFTNAQGLDGVTNYSKLYNDE